jgi:hypothetical protein
MESQMAKTFTQRFGIFLLLALVMAATRLHHFSTIPDASWGVFFLAGFWLRGSARWAFVLLIAEAVLIDFFVITGQGLDFWTHYCVSPAYWSMPAYFGALWLGGSWVAARQPGSRAATVGQAAGALLVSEAACYLISNGSFYWLSNAVPLPRSAAGWMSNLGDWYLPFLGTTALYVGIGAALHVAVMSYHRSRRANYARAY